MRNQDELPPLLEVYVSLSLSFPGSNEHMPCIQKDWILKHFSSHRTIAHVMSSRDDISSQHFGNSFHGWQWRTKDFQPSWTRQFRFLLVKALTWPRPSCHDSYGVPKSFLTPFSVKNTSNVSHNHKQLLFLQEICYFGAPSLNHINQLMLGFSFIQKSFIDVFYHQIRNGIQGYTTRAPPLSCGGRGRTGDQTIASPMPWPLGHIHPPMCRTAISENGTVIVSFNQGNWRWD